MRQVFGDFLSVKTLISISNNQTLEEEKGEAIKGLLERLEASDLIMLIKREAGEPAGTTRISAETMMASQLINCLFKAVAVDEFGGRGKLRVVATSSSGGHTCGTSGTPGGGGTLQIIRRHLGRAQARTQRPNCCLRIGS